MTNEERDIITQFIARVSGAQAAGQPSFGWSVPATTTPALPPVDPEADRLIADLFGRYPEARYRITQLAFVQEHALAEAQNRIQRLEWELQQARQVAQQAQQQLGSGSGGGFFSEAIAGVLLDCARGISFGGICCLAEQRHPCCHVLHRVVCGNECGGIRCGQPLRRRW